MLKGPGELPDDESTMTYAVTVDAVGLFQKPTSATPAAPVLAPVTHWVAHRVRSVAMEMEVSS